MISQWKRDTAGSFSTTSAEGCSPITRHSVVGSKVRPSSRPSSTTRWQCTTCSSVPASARAAALAELVRSGAVASTGMVMVTFIGSGSLLSTSRLEGRRSGSRLCMRETTILFVWRAVPLEPHTVAPHSRGAPSAPLGAQMDADGSK